MMTARSQRTPSISAFLQQSVEETIMPGVRQDLPMRAAGACNSGKLEKGGIRMRLKEGSNLQPCLGREDRARRVKQFTTATQMAL